ncbi:hypothetical protein SDC9_158561 [bioreactor metagenome]|uniref:Uncharacterized protein n=1 Tax=bioreactor metagenome TaxID=1076179 RepID=A0A645FBF6_9ZZZZ
MAGCDVVLVDQQDRVRIPSGVIGQHQHAAFLLRICTLRAFDDVADAVECQS